jgi:hypothetical protein
MLPLAPQASASASSATFAGWFEYRDTEGEENSALGLTPRAGCLQQARQALQAQKHAFAP